MARRHRGVRGEYAACRHRFLRGAERQPAGEMLAQQLEDQERRMSLVQVPHGRLHAQHPQRTHAADAEDHFLAHARRLVTAVEAVGDVAVGGGVLRAVGVEQVYRDAAHLGAPQPRDHLAAGDAYADAQPGAARVAHRLDRQIARIALAVFGVLHAIVVDGLREISLLVEQSHRNEVGALIARGLAVVPGEHAEATRVDGEALVEAVLGAEVRHQRRLPGRSAHLQVGVEARERPVVALEVARIAGAALERALIDAAKHQARIAVGLLPQLGIEIFEQRPDRPVPAEKQVCGQFGQAGELPRELGGDFKERVSHPLLSRLEGGRESSSPPLRTLRGPSRCGRRRLAGARSEPRVRRTQY